jgi:hypothetical protein
MIVVNSPMKRDFIVELLESNEVEGTTFKCVERTGMKLKFETNSEDEAAAAKQAKALIKSTEIGAVLYFQCVVE